MSVALEFVKQLEDALKSGHMIVRLSLMDDYALVELEKVLQEYVAKKLNASALVSLAPQFEWWTESGVWPMYPQGWTVLLRRARVQGQVRPDVAQAAQQNKLVKG